LTSRLAKDSAPVPEVTDGNTLVVFIRLAFGNTECDESDPTVVNPRKELDMQASKGKCGCPCHKMSGLFITLIGLTFLLGAFGVLSEHAVSITWPVLVILAGLKKMTKGMCKCCDKA